MDIHTIASELEQLIVEGVESRTRGSDRHLEKYNCLVNELKSALLHAEELYNNYKEENLTISMIEAEGYLRAMKSVLSIVDAVEGWYPKED